MGLLCYLRSKRAMAEQIAELKGEVRSVNEACIQWHGKWLDNSALVDALESRGNALNAELDSVRAEANRILIESGLREERLAGLQHDLSQCEQDLLAMTSERDAAKAKAGEWGEENTELLSRIEGLTEQRDVARKTLADERNALKSQLSEALAKVLEQGRKLAAQADSSFSWRKQYENATRLLKKSNDAHETLRDTLQRLLDGGPDAFDLSEGSIHEEQLEAASTKASSVPEDTVDAPAPKAPIPYQKTCSVTTEIIHR